MKVLVLLIATAAISQAAAIVSVFSDDRRLANNSLTPRAFDGLFGGARRPWPVNDPINHPRERLIEYCFTDQVARDRLEKNLRAAISLWMTALGGEASQASGHHLVFREITDANQNPVFCRQDGAPNPQIPHDALEIISNGNKFGGKSTLGYLEGDATPLRHAMELPHGDSPRVLPDYAHEIGHLLGLEHEHQRPDRDSFVQYHPDQVYGFEEAVSTAMADTGFDRDKVIDLFVHDPRFTCTRWIAGCAFVMYSDTGGAPAYMRGPYDKKSIMHYDSIVGRKNRASNPLLWKKGYYINLIEKPSEKDAEFVKDWYPW